MDDPKPPTAANSPSASYTPLERHLRFLFSDSNLHKDAHFRGLLWPGRATGSGRGVASGGTQPYPAGPVLRLSELLAFPRVSALAQRSLTELRTGAARCSPELVLSADGQLVGRGLPWLPPPPGFYDSRTLYVDNVPQGLGAEALAECFGQWGALAHTALPRAGAAAAGLPAAARPHRGFAFLEYEREEGAAAALAAVGAASREGGEASQPLPLHLRSLTVMPKAAWAAYKAVVKAASAAAAAASTAADSEHSSAAGGALPLGALLRLEGLSPALPFAALAAACSAPSGRPQHIDAPEIHANGQLPQLLVNTGSGGAKWRAQCQRAAHMAACGSAAGSGGSEEAAAAAAAAAASAAAASAAAASAPLTALEEAERQAAAAAPRLVDCTVRYRSAAQALAALRHFAGETGRPLMLAGLPVQARLLAGEEERAYLQRVQAQVAAYAALSAERKRRKEAAQGGVGGGGGGGGAGSGSSSSSSSSSSSAYSATVSASVPRRARGHSASGGGGRKRGRSASQEKGSQGGASGSEQHRGPTRRIEVKAEAPT